MWQQCLTLLQAQMTRQTFAELLLGSVLVAASADEWMVQARAPAVLEPLNGRLNETVCRSVRVVVGQPLQVRFVAPAAEVLAPAEEPVIEAVHERRVGVAADGGTFAWDDYYIKLKLAFRRKALRQLRGAPLAVFLCLALHVDAQGVAHPGIDRICEETGYCRRAVIDALDYLVGTIQFVERLPSNAGATSRYRVQGYAWFGNSPATNLLENSPTACG